MTRKDAIRRIVVEIMKERSMSGGGKKLMTLEQWEGFISALLHQVDEQRAETK